MFGLTRVEFQLFCASRSSSQGFIQQGQLQGLIEAGWRIECTVFRSAGWETYLVLRRVRWFWQP